MNPPKDNPAVMPLEEVKEILREDIAICDQNIRICDENLYDEEGALLRRHRGAYLAALHHLEAGKQLRDRLLDQHEIRESLQDGAELPQWAVSMIEEAAKTGELNESYNQ